MALPRGIGIDPVEIIAGDLPPRQRRLVEAWAELRQQELLVDSRSAVGI